MKSLTILRSTVRTLAVAVFSAALITSTAVAHSHGKKKVCNFIPENSLNIPVGNEFLSGITEAEFNKVIDEVSKFYEPIIKAKGGKLQVNRKWTDGTVNASAQRSGNTWIVNMYGGLARHKVVTADGFLLVLCHELGHHLGGFPKSGGMNGWASNEGQSDYFATMKCGRRVWEKADNAAVVAGMKVPALVKEKCTLQHKAQTEINLCIRGSMGGLNLATLLWSLANGSKSVIPSPLANLADAAQPDFGTPDTSAVGSTNSAHPKAQCRLDTYFNGAICGMSFTDDFSATDPVAGACAMEKGDKMGYRPLCWYKPKSVRR